MLMKALIPILGLTLVLSACQSDNAVNVVASPSTQSLEYAQPNRIKSHVRFLADDLLEGRDTGARGHEIASLYIASEFEKYALVPAGDNGSYMQRIQFRQAFLDQSSASMTFKNADTELSLSYPSDYLTYADSSRTESSLQGKLVFVGYGIVAPELNHNDYENIDVKGKVVVVLSGKPQSFPSEEGAHFGSSNQKYKHAVANGAIGYISISTPRAEKTRPYQNLLNFLHMPQVRWLDTQNKPDSAFPEILARAYLSKDAAAKVFENAPQNLAQIYAMLEKDESPKGFDIDFSVDLRSRSQHKQISSPNVVAMLEGSDPVLKNEYVVYSAHSDHIGFAKTVKKDKINNGAMDNATGTAVLLETARLFSNLKTKPKRSILFVAVTGEERGLLGSDYFAKNPTVEQSAMVANVNLDMPILTYEFGDVIAFGANHSDMQASVTEAAKTVGITLSEDPWPDMALFTRSDHYSFVKQGIPAVFLVPGLVSVDPSVDGSKQFNNFIGTNYHKTGDDFSQNFNWKAAQKFADVNFQIGNTLANQTQRSKWNKGDFFGDTFAK